MEFSTPNLKHIQKSDFENVYEPAEDTFLFLDTLEQEYSKLITDNPLICLEIGSGSGCVITFLATILGPSRLYLAVDINPQACDISFRTGSQNNVSVDLVNTNFTDGLNKRLHGTIDVLCFNPPYVVTPTEEIGSKSIEASWAGGIDGREVIDRFLPLVDELLSPNGVFYMVVINENKPEEIMEYMADKFGFFSRSLMYRRAGWEGLSVLGFSRVEGRM